jgi:hypothetical protein
MEWGSKMGLSKIDEMIEIHKRQIKLYEELKQACELEEIKSKHDGAKIYSCRDGDLKMLFIKKNKDARLVIATSELIFSAYREGVDVTNWDEIIKYSKKPLKYQGRFETPYNLELIKNLVILKIEKIIG